MIQHEGYIEFGANQYESWPDDAMTSLIREQVLQRGRNRKRPAPPPPPAVDPAEVWHRVTLPALIAEGKIIDRGPDFLAQGFATRHAYAGAA